MILDRIVADNRLELEDRKKALPLAEVKRLAEEKAPSVDFAVALRGEGVKLIAEVKKASPSRGIIRADFNPVEIAGIYASNGAAAISVMTEPGYFQGSLDNLQEIAKALGDGRIPLLRKDFIFDPYQVYQSRAYGADALLLIVAILTPERLGELMMLSQGLGMSCMVEVHTGAELEIALESGAGIIGINNRDLRTFETDTAVTGRLAVRAPEGAVLVSESGIHSARDVQEVHSMGVNAVLVGEAIMREQDMAGKVRELAEAVK